MKKLILSIILLVAVLGLFAQLLDQAIPIRQGTNIEWFRSSTSIPEGVVYVWSDTRNGGRDLFAQLITPQGTKGWGEEGIAVDDGYDRQEDPMIITASDGNVIVAYVDFSVDPYGDIRANKLTPTGQKLWGVYGISVCDAIGEQISINLVPDQDGGAYIAWQDGRESQTQTYVQHVTSTGAITFAANGINVYPTSTGNMGSNTFWEDTNGGGVMAFEFGNDIYFTRIHKDSPGGIALPATRLAPTLPSNLSSNAKMCPDGADGFIFAWEFKDTQNENYPRLRMQRININGNLLWGNAGKNLTIELIKNQERHRIVEVSTGGAIIAWEDLRNSGGQSNRPDLYIQKVDLLGDQVWLEDGIPVYLNSENNEAWQKNLRMTKTLDNGAVIVWEDTRNLGENQEQVFTQKFNSNGTKAWTSEGILVSDTIGGQEGANVKQIGNDFAIVWADNRTGSLGLMTQLITPLGAIGYAQNGLEIYFGLSGHAARATLSIDLVVKSHQDKTMIVWNDSRHGSIFGFKMFYQIIDSNGNRLMEDNGARVSLYTEPQNMEETKLSAEVNSNGEVCIVWGYIMYGTVKYYAQIINMQGQKLLPEGGLDLIGDAGNVAGGDGDTAIIKWRNNGWEIFWQNRVPDHGNCTVGQRIEGTTLAWGPNGKVILSNEHEYGFYPVSPFDKQGDYLLFGTADETRITKLDANGNIAPGWDPLGFLVTSERDLPNTKLFVTSSHIVTFWQGYNAPIIYAAVFNLNGQPAFENHVFTLTDSESECISLVVHRNGNHFIISYRQPHYESGAAIYTIKSQKIEITSTGLINLWGENGIDITTVNSLPHDNLFSMAHGDCNLFVWDYELDASDYTKDKDIYLSMLNANGTFYNSGGSPTDGICINSHLKEQEYPQMSRLTGSKVAIAWVDAISSGKDKIYGIYAQIFDTGHVNNNDKELEKIPSLLSDIVNYPNPFNPITNIEFNLKFPSQTTIEVFNIKGQKVRSLLNDHLDAGKNIVVWDGQNDKEKNVSSGIYFYRISAGTEIITKKMILLK